MGCLPAARELGGGLEAAVCRALAGMGVHYTNYSSLNSSLHKPCENGHKNYLFRFLISLFVFMTTI
jgi:hypothetical protein